MIHFLVFMAGFTAAISLIAFIKFKQQEKEEFLEEVREQVRQEIEDSLMTKDDLK